ncbi:MAG: O-antigen ligase family protein [Acidobacteriota bacterium]
MMNSPTPEHAELLPHSFFARVSSLLASIRVESILVFWFFTSPIASFYLRYPQERSIITYDRAMIALAALIALFKLIDEKRSFVVSKFEILWSLLAAAALLSALLKSVEAAPAIKMAVDSFALPVVAFHLARHRFDTKNRGSAIVAAAIATALVVFVAGAYEMATASNLFAYKGSEIFRDREIRINGPYISDSSFAAICLLLALFLRAAPAAFRVRFDRSAHFVYVCAILAVSLGVMLALFRTTAAALVMCWVGFEILSRNRTRVNAAHQAKRLAVCASLIVAALIAWYVASPSLSERLTDPRNLYGRLATWQAATEITLENPIAGVGLSNYGSYYLEKYFIRGDEVEAFNETRAARSPHSNLMWIAAELGLTGLALYLLAHFYLLLAGYRALKTAKDASQRAAASCLLMVVAAYWITGMTLTSGAYSDLNLCFFFLCGLLLNVSRRDKKGFENG